MPDDPTSRSQQSLVLKTAQRIGATTPRELLTEITAEPDRQAEFLPWIWYLINCNAIGCDLSASLNMNSTIWPQVSEDSRS